MKAAPIVCCAIAVTQCIFCFPASAGQVDRFTCHRQSGGPMPAFTLTIDLGTKNIDVPPNSGLRPDPDTVEITDSTIKWSFMRGFVTFDRKTHELDWDTTAEYEYLAAIGQPAEQSEAIFQGRMRCRPTTGHASR